LFVVWLEPLTVSGFALNGNENTMKYMLLIAVDPTDMPEANADGGYDMGADYYAFTQRIIASGELVAGDPLHDASTATTVRVRNGELLVSDGPFAETKEVIVGFDLLECADLDEAIEVARAHPMARHGRLELRPFADL
jgi:hypothetical protein